MTVLVGLKDFMKASYAKFSFVLTPLFRFVIAFTAISFLNMSLGYMDLLNEIYIVLVLSMICAILPSQGTVVIAMLIIVGHSLSLHVVAAGCVCVILLVILLLGLRFSSKHAIALVLTPLAYVLQIPALLPICLGLVGDLFTSFTAAGGVAIWYLIALIRNTAAPLCQGEGVEALSLAQAIFQGIGQNQAMVIDIIACMATVVLVAFVRRLHADYAWQLSVAFGGICYAFVVLAGCLLLELKVNIVLLLIGTAAAMLLGFLLQFYLFGADYAATEFMQFEDDSYVYYVKAVPKYTNESMCQPSRPAEPERRSPVIETPEQPPMVERSAKTDSVDFENRLEESLKNL